jgi:cysteinyl-tRNA synthetase
LKAAAARALEEFEAGMDDDLNTAVALAAVHSLSREVNRALDTCGVYADDQRNILELVARFDSVLNIFGVGREEELLDAEIQALIEERQDARHRRDFARADQIRDELAARGITLEDTRDGVRWKRRGA